MHSHKNSSPALPWPQRLIILSIVGFCLIGSYVFTAYPAPTTMSSPGGLMDIGHQLISPLHLLAPTIGPWIWWTGSLLLNLLYAGFLIYALCYGRGIRILLALALAAFLHGLCWHLTLLPPPPDILWQFPITNLEPARINDFWFSGHVAAIMVLAWFISAHCRYWGLLAWLIVGIMIWLVLATRVHYSIDVAGAFFVSYCLFDWCRRLPLP